MSNMTVEAAGAIEKISLPFGFIQKSPTEDDSYNHYLEYFIPGTTIRICYEQTNNQFSETDRQCVQRLLEKQLKSNAARRQLNLDFRPSGEPVSLDDVAAYNVICSMFVFGGDLFRDGSFIDEENTVWELRTLRSGDNRRSFIVGHLRFLDHNGAVSSRQSCVVVPRLPDAEGCGYLWIEGTAKELERHEDEFLNCVIANGRFRP